MHTETPVHADVRIYCIPFTLTSAHTHLHALLEFCLQISTVSITLYSVNKYFSHKEQKRNHNFYFLGCNTVDALQCC